MSIWNKSDKLNFGKHKGKTLDEVPDPYLIWMMFNLQKTRPTVVGGVKSELLKRGYKIEWLYQKHLESLLLPTPQSQIDRAKKYRENQLNKIKNFLDSTVGSKYDFEENDDDYF